MELSTAIKLIKEGIPKTNKPQRWVDLGAGTGLFTKALAQLLPTESFILAIDQDARSLRSIPEHINSITIHTQTGNFIETDLKNNWDGILMANALHYVPHSKDFLNKIKASISPAGRIIIIEYERRQANAWVPYPIDFSTLAKLSEQTGFTSVIKLHEVPSVFDNAKIYSALLSV